MVQDKKLRVQLSTKVSLLVVAAATLIGPSAGAKVEAAGQPRASLQTAKATVQRQPSFRLAQLDGSGRRTTDQQVCDWIQARMWDAWWRGDSMALQYYQRLFYKYNCNRVPA